MLRKHHKFALLALTLTSGATIATPAIAQDSDDIVTSASVTLTTDYRFRGISLSDKKPALQGSFEVSKGGLYVGTWASSLTSELDAALELDYYGGYRGTAGKLDYDVGLTVYTYPDLDDSTYFEGYAYVSGSVDKVSLTTGAAYVFGGQDNLADDNGLYLILDSSTPFGESGLSFNTHLGYEDGVFADKKWDWTVGLSVPVKNFSLSLDYVDTNQSFREADAGVMFSLGASF